MTVSGILDVVAIKEELVVFLRNQDIFSTTLRGVTTVTEEFDGDGLDTTFVLTNTPVRNVRSVTVGGSSVSFGSDYTVNYSTATVTFTSAPGVGTDNVDIQYDYGSTDRIYPDIPRTDITVSSYPRISVQITSTRTSELALGGLNTISDHLISIYVYDDNGDDVDNYIKTVRTKFLENKKNFYYNKFITPIASSPMIYDPNRVDKIVQRTLELRSLFNEETVS